ncbi:hypothetical protein BPS26883_04674 [Burkholderia pseudomultivorans]|uniref:Bacteriophage protein n=1 Tax=Burkholderia pseudomultivorans TaxID=1207504 RepID=A0A6P2NPR0_9BURK|nr:hypothetical protein [Burkholderia pseudomultivorans]VWB96633.1 hypothetical protein BPS26883_04674 [Burkholderia pseudomultivorans]
MAKKQPTSRKAPMQEVLVPSALSSAITAISYEGLSIATPTGETATLAVVDEKGNVIEKGPAVARAVWDVAIAAYRNFLTGTGHLRVLTKPTTFES